MSAAAIAAIVAGLALVARCLARERRLLHLLQLEHYEPARLFLWLRRRNELVAPRALAIELGPVVAALALWIAGVRAGTLGACVGLACATVAFASADLRRSAIKPLVYTGRARRLTAAAGAPALAVWVGGLAASLASGLTVPALVALLVLVACIPAAPWLLAGANRALAPLQCRIDGRFVTSAQRRLEQWRPLTIGVTGSYGKTTVKFCIGAVLARQQPTLVTPESYNSYLGVVRTINERLSQEHQAFVVEMGMYRAGDIAELCALVRPRIGVITAIGPVHLERLGSLDAIAAAKGELAEALGPDGQLVLNGDDPRCRALAARSDAPVTLYGIESSDAAVRALDVALQDGRTTFRLALGGEEATVVARLLGVHNVSNLLAAAAVGHCVGMSLADIVAGLETIEPPPHRLEPIRNERAGIVVIDDAYNSNPAGAQAALEVLREHPARRRILVTPGMVELGELEQELNERFGRQAAEVCDHVILVGPRRTRPVAAGLRAGGLGDAAITVVLDLAAATSALRELTRAGDVVLFENDLPDTYAEQVVARS